MEHLDLFSSSPPIVETALRNISLLLMANLTIALVMFLTTNLKAYYGRYTTEGEQVNFLWSIVIPGLIDWIGHCTSLIAVAYACQHAPIPITEFSLPRIIMLSAFSIHYFNRSFVHAWLVRNGCKEIPLLTMLLGSGFCFVNGLNIARYLTFPAVASHLDAHHYVTSSRFLIGMTMWMIGFIGNVSHDRYLVYLKSLKKGYLIPRRGLFTKVTGANFFFEIVEWAGFWIAGGGWSTLAFFWVTACAIGPRAYHHHQWYKEKFGASYPADRRVLIPYVL